MLKPEPVNWEDPTESIDAYYDAQFEYEQWIDEHYVESAIKGVRVCRACRAMVDDPDKHTVWHYAMDDKLE